MTKLQAWAEKLAEKYDIGAETVIGIYSSFENYIWRDGRRIGRKERTASFLKLYFEEVRRNNNGIYKEAVRSN